MADGTILLGGFAHETNTFAAGTTDRVKFQERQEYFGTEIPEKMRDTNTCEGGAISVAEDRDLDLRYTVSAAATPSGVVDIDTYDFYCGKILDGVQEYESDLDGVCLCLHGAMVPKGMNDGEGPLVSMVRETVGPDVPIAVTLDLHGNISDELVEVADILVAYECYPHTDMGATGRRAMRFLDQMLQSDLDPITAIERPPFLPMGPMQNTREGPMAEVMAKAREYEDRDDVVKVNVFAGFHQADVPSMGFSIPVIADGDPVAATEVARKMAAYVWDRRQDFVAEFPKPEEAVAETKRITETHSQPRGLYDVSDNGPVVLADLGDNPGGGGTADGTTVLRELIDQEIYNAGFAIMCDPEVVAECVEAGVGSRVVVTLGGKTDDRHGAPIADVDGYVKAISDGEFCNTGPMGTGSESHIGRSVHLQCGSDDQVNVLLTEQRHQPLDAEIWRQLGIQPERLSVLVVKSTNHFRADYEPIASEVIPVNSIGLVSVDPRHFDYEQVSRPKFPLDEMADNAYPTWT